MKIDQIIKRDFNTKVFHLDKITEAIYKAMVAVEVGTYENAQDVALSVYKTLLDRKNEHSCIPCRKMSVLHRCLYTRRP